MDVRPRPDPLIVTMLVATLVSLAAVVVAAVFPGSAGGAHPRFAGMAISGGSASETTRLLGWTLGAAQITFFSACFGLGLRRPVRRRLPRALWGLALTWQLVWVAFCWLDAASPARAGGPLVLGFPPSTALLLFGLWPLPVAFVGWWILNFDRYVLSPEDAARFETELAALQAPETGDATPGPER